MIGSDGKNPRFRWPHCRLPPWSWPILLSAVAWSVLMLAIPPSRQNFPLGDDWAFSRGAFWFAQGHGVHYTGWSSIPQLGQWLCSVPFVLVLGPSHVALRLSTIVLSWLGLVSLYDLVRRQGLSPRMAAFVCCVIAMNPLFFVSQATYMTDVPALSFGLIALDCYSRAMAQRNLPWLTAAVLFALLGCITRQTLLVVPMVAGFLLARLPDLRLKPIWATSVIAPVIVCVTTTMWFMGRPDVVPMEPTVPSLGKLAFVLFLAIHSCGLSVLPICLMAFRPRSWPLFLAALAAMLFLAGYWFHFGKRLPYGGTFPYCSGMLSPWGTYSANLVIGTREVVLTPTLRVMISILGCVGGAAILISTLDAVRKKSAWAPLTLFTLLNAILLLFMPTMYDRYLVILFPGAACLVAAHCAESRLHWLAGTAGVGMYGLVSVGLVHDWLSWNSARWELGREAMAQGIEPNDIEGGFEWNGWFSIADPARPLPKADFNARFLNDETTLALMPFGNWLGNFCLVLF